MNGTITINCSSPELKYNYCFGYSTATKDTANVILKGTSPYLEDILNGTKTCNATGKIQIQQ